MKLLQWNIWYKEDAKNILKALRETDADIICLQELTVNHPEYNKGVNVPEFLAKELGFNYVFAPAVEEGDQKFGNGIFTRYPILSSEMHFIQNPPESGKEVVDYSEEGRIYVEATIQLNDGKIDIGTVHKSYVDRFAMTPAKEVETNKLLDILKGKKENFIFTGDLNALPGSYPVNEISKILKHCGPDLTENTWTTKPFSYNGFEANTLDWRLDYCFATPDVQIKSSEIIETEYSDHLPVLIEF
ncbi:hypothetical protein BH11PAT2_BH11PAT2_01510 [soil metagenome]